MKNIGGKIYFGLINLDCIHLFLCCFSLHYPALPATAR